MILFNAALVGAYWERLLVLRLEQRRVAGQEPHSEQRSAGQPGYSGESLVHLHLHRAPISAIQPMDIPPTAIRHTGTQAMDTEPTHSRAMDIRGTPVLPHMLVPRAMGTRADLGSRITPLPPATDIPATRNSLLTSVRRATNTKPMKAILRTRIRRAMDHRAIWDAPLTLVSSLTGIRTARFLHPTRVPVMGLPHIDTPAIAHRRGGRLGLGTVRSFRLSFCFKGNCQRSVAQIEVGAFISKTALTVLVVDGERFRRGVIPMPGVDGTETELCERLAAILRATSPLMEVLTVARHLGLPDWLVFSGAVYQPVFNHLTGRPLEYGIKDYDLAYFDASDLSYDAASPIEATDSDHVGPAPSRVTTGERLKL